MKLHHFVIAGALLTSLFVNSGYAENTQGQRNGQRGPPQVALDACSSLSEGAACSFTGRNSEELSGTCFAPSETELTCKPEGHEGGKGNGRGEGRGNEQ
jgi:hypothetical protein